LVNQKYLGTAENIRNKVLASEKLLQDSVLYSNEAEFGAVMLVYDIAKRLGIIEIIDGILSKRKQGASSGTYILTASINRVTNPTSKSGLSEWYSNTCLPVVLGFKSSVFSPQNFWNNTCISSKALEQIEEEILKKIVATYPMNTTHIIYDATNFFTYIDTMQDCELAKRGHSKEKRNDLRIVGLSLMVSPDFAIPLLHETYPGNRPDTKQFPIMMERLKTRYEAITKKKSDVTVVFDRGNNSEDNIGFLESGEFKLHYVGGLNKNQVKELFDIDRIEYTPLNAPSLDKQTAYRREMEVYGRKVIAVIIYNYELEKGQMQGIIINRKKAEAGMLELQQKLIRRADGEVTKGKKPTVESTKKAVEKILKAEYMQDIFSYEIVDNGGIIHLSYDSSDEKLEQIRYGQLGKTALFTDREDFTNEQIVIAYRSASHIESAFRQMKDPRHFAVRPIFHWTDEKIRVHIFSCVLALRLCSILSKELSDNGISVSINRLIDEMSFIKKINTFFGDLNKPEKVESFTQGSELAQQIEQLYKLKEKYS